MPNPQPGFQGDRRQEQADPNQGPRRPRQRFFQTQTNLTPASITNPSGQAFVSNTAYGDFQNNPSLAELVQSRLQQGVPSTEESPFVADRDDIAGAWKNSQASRGLQGNQLNSIDTQMSSGLEVYLKTPAFRLPIIRDRLVADIKTLKNRLAQYNTLTSPSEEACNTRSLLQHRLDTLEQHLDIIQLQLDMMAEQSSWMVKAAHKFGKWAESFGKQTEDNSILNAIRLKSIVHKFDPDRATMEELNHSLSNLTQLVSDNMSNPGQSDNDNMGDILIQYDATLKDIQAVAKRLQSRQDWRDHANERLAQWYRKFYS